MSELYPDEPWLGYTAGEGSQPPKVEAFGAGRAVVSTGTPNEVDQTRQIQAYESANYAKLWREAEDRAAANAVEIAFAKENERKALAQLEAQKEFFNSAAVKVRDEVLSLRSQVDDKKRDLNAMEAKHADLERRLVQAEEANRTTRSEGENEMPTSSEGEVRRLEQSLRDLSSRLQELSTTEQDDGIPLEMHTNHVWQQATSAAKARTRSQRASAYAAQANAEAMCSSLRRELQAQKAINAELNKRTDDLQTSLAEEESKSASLKDDIERTYVKDIEAMTKGLEESTQENKRLQATLGQTEERYAKVMNGTKELARSLMSDLDKQAGDSGAGEIVSFQVPLQDGGPGGADEEGGAASEKGNSMMLLKEAIRKTKATSKYLNASARAQLQAKETALAEASAEREKHKQERQDLEERIDVLTLKLQNAQIDLDRTKEELEATSFDKESYLALSKDQIDDLQGQLKACKGTLGILKSDNRELMRKMHATVNAEAKLKESQGEIETLHADKDALLKDLEKMKANRGATKESFQRVVAGFTEKVDDLKGKLSESETRATELEKEVSQREALVSSLEEAKTKSDKALADCLEELQRRDERMDAMAGRLEALRSELDTKASALARRESELQSTSVTNDTLRKRIEDVLVKVTEDSALIHSLNEETDYLKGLLSQREESVQRIEGEVSQLQQANRELKNAMKSEESEASKRSVEVERLNTHITTQQSELERYVELLTETTSSRDKLQEKYAELKDSLGKQLSEYSKNRTKYTERSHVLEEQLDALKESAARKAEHLKLYEANLMDLALCIKNCTSVAFGKNYPELLASFNMDLNQESASLHDDAVFDAAGFDEMKKIVNDFFPLIAQQIDLYRQQKSEAVTNLQSAQLESGTAIRDMQKQLDSLKQERSELRHMNEDLQADHQEHVSHLIDLKRSLQSSSAAIAKMEVEGQHKSAQIAHLTKELAKMNRDGKSFSDILDLLRGVQSQLVRFLLAMEVQLESLEASAVSVLKDGIQMQDQSGTEALSEMQTLLCDIRNLQSSFKQQSEIIISFAERRNTGGVLHDDESALMDEKENLHTLHQELKRSASHFLPPSPSSKEPGALAKRRPRPWWQHVLILPVRLLPAMLIVSTSTNVGTNHTKLWKRKGRNKQTKAPLQISNGQDESFFVPTNGTRVIDEQELSYVW